jgi:hypothetical protein
MLSALGCDEKPHLAWYADQGPSSLSAQFSKKGIWCVIL